MAYVFEWHAAKAVSNRRKHAVTFDEAVTVFDDPLAAIFADPDHSDLDETREILIGYSATARLLVISFTERANGRVRIISAREATAYEQSNHEENG